MKASKSVTTIKLLLVLMAFSLTYESFGQKENDGKKIKICVLKHHGIPSFPFPIPFYSRIIIDSKEQLKLKNGEYALMELEKTNHLISLPNNESYSIDGKKDNYYFIILFRKRIFWRKHDLIEVTEEYFNSIELEKYREYNSSDQIKWY